MDPNTAMEAATEGAKALTKFQEIVQKVFGPRWTRKQADADAYADERKLKTIRDNPDMEIVYIGGEMHARERTPEMLIQRAEHRMLTEAIRQEENIENVLEIAAQELQQDEDVSDEVVDEDWITRLFNIVKDISNKEMQCVWGKILAGEIKRPGSFSLRTLDTIRNLATNEAKLFQKVLPFVMCLGTTDAFISSDKEILKRYNISYDDILELDEAGLVKSKALRTTLKIIPHKPLCISNKNYTLVFWNQKEQIETIDVSNYALTKAGFELFSLLSVDENLEYDCMLAEQLVKANSNKVRISVNKIISKSKDSVNFVATPIESYDE